MNARTPANRGFTLLEMIAATAMVAMLAASLYVSLHIAFRAKQSAETSIETVRKGGFAMELIKADLQSAASPGGSLAGTFVGSVGMDLLGPQGTDLTFQATATDIEPGPGIGDIKRIEYYCNSTDNSGSLVLVRRITTNLLAPVTPEPKEEILCRNVRTFALKYFDGLAWQDTWDSASQGDALPMAVEVTIELEGDSAPGLPTSQVVSIPCGVNASASASAAPGGLP